MVRADIKLCNCKAGKVHCLYDYECIYTEFLPTPGRCKEFCRGCVYCDSEDKLVFTLEEFRSAPQEIWRRARLFGDITILGKDGKPRTILHYMQGK